MISDVRGLGLLIGVEFSEPIAKKVLGALFEKHYVANAVGDKILRLAPPLILTKQDADDFVNVLTDILKGE